LTVADKLKDYSIQSIQPQPPISNPQSPSPSSRLSAFARVYLENFNKALEDDLNTPRALAELWGLLKDSSIEPKEALAAAFDMDRVLGLKLEEAAFARDEVKEDPAIRAEIEQLIAERKEAKAAKNFGRADEIRQQLKDRGIMLEDSAQGTSWRKL
jgi:cysteinyl-tRNA synthetase